MLKSLRLLNVKCLILLLLSLSFPIKSDVKIWGTVAATSVIGIWGAYKYKNLKAQLQNCQQIIKEYESEKKQLKDTEKLLSNIAIFIENLSNDYSEELQLCVKLKSEAICSVIIKKCLQNQKTVNLILSDLIQIVEKIQIYYQQIKSRKAIWDKNKKKEKIIEQLCEKEKSLINLEEKLKVVILALKKNISNIELVIFLENDNYKIYLNEIDSFRDLNSNIFTEFHKHIKAYMNKSQFPYIAYVDMIDGEKQYLTSIVNKIYVNDTQTYPDYLEKAQELLLAFDQILKFVVSTEEYKREKNEKPLFEREQARFVAELQEKEAKLAIELKEKQAKIDNDQKIAQAKLLKKQSQNQKLVNESKRLDREKQELRNREQLMLLELARIRDGETIRDAIASNDRKWKKDYNELNLKNKANENHVSSLLTQVSDLRLKLQEMQRRTDENSNSLREVQALKSKIQTIQSKVNEVKSNLNTPPFNPDLVDGLREYLQKLYSKLSEISFAL